MFCEFWWKSYPSYREGPTVEKAQANAYEHARQIKSDNLFIVMILGIKPSLSKIGCSI